MKPFVIQYTVRAVVMAEDESDAWTVADDQWRKVSSDETPIVEVDGEVKSAASLPYGWDLQCVPYGGSGNTRLSELLATRTAAQAATDTAKG